MPKPAESFAGHRAPFAPKRLAVAVLFASAAGTLVLTSPAVSAAGLGRLNVLSGLGQALNAEIDVTSLTPEELQSLQVKLASPDAFQQAGIDMSPALQSVRMALDRSGPRTFVRLTSTQPISDPYVDLLVELSWANGRLVREYTFLLDPPELKFGRQTETVPPAVGASAPTAAVAAPMPAPAPVAPAASAGAASAPSVRTAGPAAAPTTARPAAAGEYTVRHGDTLGKIANQTKGENVTLDQMLVALFRSNPDAFAGNMNRLKTGSILRVPDSNQAAGVEAAEARKIVVAQTADFAAYRARLAGSVAAGEAKAGQQDERAASGKIGPQVEDKGAAKSASGDQVKLARPQDAAKGAAGGGAAGAAAADALAAKDKAISESKQRIAELEKNVSDLKGLVATQNKIGADAQKAADAKKAEDARKAEEAKKAEAAKQAEAARKAEEAKKAAEPKPVQPAADQAKSAEPAPAAEAPKPVEAAKPAVKPAAPVPAEEAPGLVESLVSSPWVLGGVAGIVALLGGYFMYSRSRKKRFEKFQDSILTGGDLKTNSIFGTTGGQSVDTTDSTFNSNFTPSASQIDSNEVDPIAEADVYIAYGRDAQAEEILKEALKTTPDRHAVRVKLLEIYASRRDLPAFEAVAGELYSRTGGHGEEWEKAAGLGRSLDPRNPLYGGSSDAVTATATGVGALAAGTVTQALADTALGTPAAPVDVDFDLDLESRHHEPLDEPTPVDFDPSVPAGDILAKSSEGFDFNSTIPAARTELLDSGSLAAPAVDFDLDAPAPELPAFDAIPMPAVTSSIPAPEVVRTTPRDPLDFDIELPDTVIAPIEPDVPHREPGALDLSGISLDLGTGAAAAMPAVAFQSGGDGELSGKLQEMATKLDLAAAYQEIGDREGAQELLDEVVRGGDPSQQQRAKQMLEALG